MLFAGAWTPNFNILPKCKLASCDVPSIFPRQTVAYTNDARMVDRSGKIQSLGNVDGPLFATRLVKL